MPNPRRPSRTEPRRRVLTRALPGIRLPVELEEQLVAYCREHDTTISDAVREGLRLLLDLTNPVTLPPRDVTKDGTSQVRGSIGEAADIAKQRGAK